VAKDPIGFGGGQGNLYAYVGSDPLNHVDPTGLKDYSREEVNEILRDYRRQIDTSTRQELFVIMWLRHGACKTDDYYCDEPSEAPGDFNLPDTFDVNGKIMGSAQFGNYIAGYGAGYWGDPVVYGIVRIAGSGFGISSVIKKHDPFTWDQLIFLGDNTDSVLHIDMGYAAGLGARARNLKRDAKRILGGKR
jgi:hypothetical protein